MDGWIDGWIDSLLSYLGAYFNSNFGSTSPEVPRPTTGIWNQIEVGGVTMQAAISAWWKAPETAASALKSDAGWNATGSIPAVTPTISGVITPYYTYIHSARLRMIALNKVGRTIHSRSTIQLRTWSKLTLSGQSYVVWRYY